MLFWTLPIIFLVLGAFLALGWFFNADSYHSIQKTFGIQITIGVIGNFYLLPALAYTVWFDGSKDLYIIQGFYLIFFCAFAIMTAFKGLMIYREKYILVHKE